MCSRTAKPMPRVKRARGENGNGQGPALLQYQTDQTGGAPVPVSESAPPKRVFDELDAHKRPTAWSVPTPLGLEGTLHLSVDIGRVTVKVFENGQPNAATWSEDLALDAKSSRMLHVYQALKLEWEDVPGAEPVEEETWNVIEYAVAVTTPDPTTKLRLDWSGFWPVYLQGGDSEGSDKPVLRSFKPSGTAGEMRHKLIQAMVAEAPATMDAIVTTPDGSVYALTAEQAADLDFAADPSIYSGERLLAAPMMLLYRDTVSIVEQYDTPPDLSSALAGQLLPSEVSRGMIKADVPNVTVRKSSRPLRGLPDVTEPVVTVGNNGALSGDWQVVNATPTALTLMLTDEDNAFMALVTNDSAVRSVLNVGGSGVVVATGNANITLDEVASLVVGPGGAAQEASLTVKALWVVAGAIAAAVVVNFSSPHCSVPWATVPMRRS